MTTEYMAQVYADIKAEPSPRTDPAAMEARLRNFTMWGDQPDGIIRDAADAIRDTLKDLAQVTAERDAADRRVKELESALIVTTADRDRLGGKVRAMVAATEPQTWAENSRNRNRILEIAMTDDAERSTV